MMVTLPMFWRLGFRKMGNGCIQVRDVGRTTATILLLSTFMMITTASATATATSFCTVRNL